MFKVGADKYEAAISLQPEAARPSASRVPNHRPIITTDIQLRVPPSTEPVLLLHEETRRDSTYVQFVHACLGSPPPTTFLRAVEKGYLSGENQFPRLTSRLVRKHMPSSEATAKGHLTKTPTAQPHKLSDSVSARRRAHIKAQRNARTIKSEDNTPSGPQTKPAQVFDPTTVPKSTSLHLDYTGRLPTRGSTGTLYLLVACWGSYIHLEPLSSMTGAATAVAIKSAVTFFRDKRVTLTTIRMDNQSSPEVRQLALELDLRSMGYCDTISKAT